MGTPFRHSILAGDELIRDAIRSSNFSIDNSEGVTGWRIARDGSAIFNNVTIGSPNWIIDENGNAVFSQISADDIIVAGESLADFLANKPDGIVARGIVASDSSSTTLTAELGIMELSAIMEPNRMYRVATTALLVRGNTLNDEFAVRIRYRQTSPPTFTSNIFIAGFCKITDTDLSGVTPIILDTIIECRDDVASDGILTINSGLSRFLLTLQRSNGSGTAFLSTNGGQFNPITMYVEDLGPIIPNTAVTSGVGGGSTPGTTQQTKTYTAEWSASWYGFGKRSGNRAYQGNSELGDGTGDQYGKIGFDYTTIQSDLAGATIDLVELRMSNEHSWNSSGLTARFGWHNNATEPSGSSSTSGDFNQVTSSYSKGQTKYVTLPNSVGEGLRDDTIKGITTGRTDAGNRSDYGYWYGADASSGKIPQLRITYTK